MISTLKLATSALVLAALASAATAERFEANKVIGVSTLPGWKDADGTHITALKIDLAPGWVTYWRVPGDAGIPMEYDWRDSKNISGLSIVWPQPEVDEKFGLTSFVYRDSVVLPIKITPETPDQDIELTGTIELGVCKDICVPVQFDIAQALPTSATVKSQQIQTALKNAPVSERQAGLAPTTCAISPTDRGIAVTTKTLLPRDMGQIHAVIEHSDQSFWVGPTDTNQQGHTVQARAEIENDSGAAFALQRQDVRITLLGQRGVIDIQGCVGDS